jgi:hypothetical protein
MQDCDRGRVRIDFYRGFGLASSPESGILCDFQIAATEASAYWGNE